MPYQIENLSVISPSHPNNRRESHDGNGSYTYQTKSTKQKLKFSLGWELEANHQPTRIPSGVEQISDGSVNGDGAEFIVMPAITKSPRYVLGLLKDLVHAPKLNTDKSCGFHIHVGASNLSVSKMRQWAIATEHLAVQIEDKAFNAVPDSRKGNSYCRRISPIRSGVSFQARKYGNDRRYNWLNTVEMFRPGGIRTIEVRLLGNTHRWKYLLAWSVFCMELASRGWMLSQRPFEIAPHVDALSDILDRITMDIKPLEKRGEPIPQWIYDRLTTFGILPNAFDRPLAHLCEMEADVKGYLKKYYSDNQMTEENSEREDEDDSGLCSCGCGEDGDCSDYRHSNGDCDRSYCSLCHDDENCTGPGRCDTCIDNAHNENEDCTVTTCSRCRRTHRAGLTQSHIVIDESSNVSDPLNLSVISDQMNVVLDEMSTALPREGVAPLTAGLMRNNNPVTGSDISAALSYAIHPTIPQIQLAAHAMMRDQLLYGISNPASVGLNPSTSNITISYDPVTPRQGWYGPLADAMQRTNDHDMEFRAMEIITTTEMLDSNRRERNSNGGI